MAKKRAHSRPGRTQGSPVRSPAVRWDDFLASEPHGSAQWAGSDRGWGYADLPRLGQDDGHQCVGFYMDCGGEGAGSGRFFARAYVMKAGALGVHTENLGEGRFRTAAAARRFVERAVRRAAARGAA